MVLCEMLTLSALVGGLLGAPAGSAQEASSSAENPLPYVLKTVHANLVTASSPPSVPGPMRRPVGTVVANSDVGVSVVDGDGVRFALGNYAPPGEPGEQFAVLSTDGGLSWRVAGPIFHVDAAQGPAGIDYVGRLGSHGAYFWGNDLVWVTTDDGSQWWESDFSGNGVHRATATHGVLDVVAMGDQLKNGWFEAFQYVSKDSGRSWTLHQRLRNVF